MLHPSRRSIGQTTLLGVSLHRCCPPSRSNGVGAVPRLCLALPLPRPARPFLQGSHPPKSHRPEVSHTATLVRAYWREIKEEHVCWPRPGLGRGRLVPVAFFLLLTRPVSALSPWCTSCFLCSSRTTSTKPRPLALLGAHSNQRLHTLTFGSHILSQRLDPIFDRTALSA